MENKFVIKTGKGFFTGFDENKITYIVDNAPNSYECAIHYETEEEAREDAGVFDGQVININKLHF